MGMKTGKIIRVDGVIEFLDGFQEMKLGVKDETYLRLSPGEYSIKRIDQERGSVFHHPIRIRPLFDQIEEE